MSIAFRMTAALVLSASGLLAASTAIAAPTASCNRACLEGFVERYLDAVTENRPDKVALAPGVRFTEDGQQLVIGDGLWNSMRAKGGYRLFVSDVPAGQVVVLATIEEDHREAGKSTGAMAIVIKPVDQIRLGPAPITPTDIPIANKAYWCFAIRARRSSALACCAKASNAITR